MRRRRLGRLVCPLTLAGALALPLILRSPFSLHVLIMLSVYGVLGQAWNIIGGYAGQVSLGHTVFFGIGAYTSTMLLIRMNLSPWIGMVCGMGASAVLSVAIGYPCFRLSGKYFVIATIAVLQIMQTLITGTEWLGGAVGLSLPLREESLANLQFHSSKAWYAYIALAMFALATYVVYRLDTSRPGYYFRAIRESEEAAESLGINTVRYKLYAMVISAVFTSAVGTLYAQYVMFIDPSSVVSYSMAIKMCLLVILGGAGTVWGPVLGATFLIPLSEMSRALLGGGGRGVDLIIYGLLITLITIFRPDGIAGILESKRVRVADRGGAPVGAP